MATFPALDSAGTAYQLQIWRQADGAIPVVLGFPGVPDVSSPELEAIVHGFAETLAAHFGATVTHVARYRTAREELPPPPEPTT